VRKGIRLIRTGKRIGLNALAGVAAKDIREITATDIGFILGPRLNAAGRMESALQAFDLLIAEDRGTAGVIAQKLDDQNTERQKATRKAVEKAQAGVGDLSGKYLISAFDAEFSSGIVGLVASKLVEGNYRPACVGHIEGDFIRASCRSIPEFHITDALDECADLLERHGGHAMAAGFTVRRENVDSLVERLEQIAERELAEKVDLRPVLRADLEIAISDIRPEMYAELANLQPVGMNNPGAVFVARDVTLDRMQLMGKEKTHLNFSPKNSSIAKAVAFNQAEWFDLWRKGNPPFDLVFTIDVNHYFDQATLQLHIRDMRPSGVSEP
jgi:single-stranded-DNA-specific exonuclease